MNRNRRPKCELIPIHEYDGKPPTVFEDENHRYVKGHSGHFLRLTRKTCSLCGSSASFVAIFNYKRHKRVQRFCKEHAARFGTLPEVNEQIEQEEITNKEKLAILTGTKIKI